MPRLIILTKTGTPRQITLADGKTTLGRTDRNTVVLDSPLVSRSHAAIDVAGADATVTDLGSSNGTLVNGRRVQSHRLRNRDVLDIGDFQLRFLKGGEATAALPLALLPESDFTPFDSAAYPRTLMPRR